MTLDKVKLGKEVIIQEIHCSGETKRRMLDLGMIKGTKIKPLLKSPLGDPTAYKVRGTLMAIRQEEAKQIEISCYSNEQK